MQLNIVFAIFGLCAAVQETSSSVLQEFKNLWTHPENRIQYLLSALSDAELSFSPTRGQVLDLLTNSPPMHDYTADDWKKVVKAIEKHLVENFFMYSYYPTAEAREIVFKSLMNDKDLTFSLTQEKFVDVDTFLDQEFGEERITVVQALRRHIDAVDDATDEEPLVAAFFAFHQTQEARRGAFVQWMNDEEIPVFGANDVTPGDAFLESKPKTLAIFGSNQDEVFYALRKYVDTKRNDIMALLIVTLCFTLAYSISWFIKFRLDLSKKRASVGCDLFAAFGPYTIPHWFAIMFISIELGSPGAMRTGILLWPGILYAIYLISASVWYGFLLASDENNEDKKKVTKADFENPTSFVIYCSFLGPLIAWFVAMWCAQPKEDENLRTAQIQASQQEMSDEAPQVTQP